MFLKGEKRKVSLWDFFLSIISLLFTFIAGVIVWVIMLWAFIRIIQLGLEVYIGLGIFIGIILWASGRIGTK